MLFTICTPVLAGSAGTYGYAAGTWTRWHHSAGEDGVLTANGTLNGTAVTAATPYLSRPYTTQCWMLKRQPGDGSYRMYNDKDYNNSTGRGYTLNIRYGMCTTLYDNPANRSDSEIDLNTINASQNLYRIKLPYWNVYLTGSRPGARCSWEFYTESNRYQRWTALGT